MVVFVPEPITNFDIFKLCSDDAGKCRACGGTCRNFLRYSSAEQINIVWVPSEKKFGQLK
jgi:hypothetical protein